MCAEPDEPTKNTRTSVPQLEVLVRKLLVSLCKDLSDGAHLVAVDRLSAGSITPGEVTTLSPAVRSFRNRIGCVEIGIQLDTLDLSPNQEFPPWVRAKLT